jgi:hypothetical protein
MRLLRIALVATLGALSAVPASAGPFGAWAALIVAGDNTADGGAPTEVFDNARRELAAYIDKIGFETANIRQFSTRPGRYVEATLDSEYSSLEASARALTQTVRGGCFLYMMSHGAPFGLVLDGEILPPEALSAFVNEMCGDNLSVIIISACYSGVFIPALAADNRMIFTAARHDRSSFGCSADLTYTFFDQCVLEALPQSETFPAMANEVMACVRAREELEGMTPPSEPQLYVGGRAAQLLEFYTLDPG